MRRTLLATLTVLSLATPAFEPAFAQAPTGTPSRIRGTVHATEGKILVVDTRKGETARITLAPN